MPVTKILTAGIGEANLRDIDVYRSRGGYKQWERAVRELQAGRRARCCRKIGIARTRRRRFPDRT